MSKLLKKMDQWMEYSRHAWIESGSPPQLDPALIINQPVNYNMSIYKWFEAHYNQIYQQVYKEIEPISKFINEQPAYFVQRWTVHYDPITIWKQLLPLFVFARVLGGIHQHHIEIAKAYAIGIAIPSMVVDRMLDTAYEEKQDWLLCLTAYTLAIDLFHEVLESPQRIEKIFLHYSKTMYYSMWQENQVHFQLPTFVSAETLAEYINSGSRLLSSVFFGSTTEMAFILANQALPTTFPDALLALRKVRQINDELVDLDEDIQHGILTYPYLHCLSSVQWRQQLAKNIQEIWRTDLVLEKNAKLPLLAKECRALLQQAGSYVATALVSVTLLNMAAKAMMEYFPANNAFEITLLLNHRLSHLTRQEEHQWQRIPHVYEPNPFALSS